MDQSLALALGYVAVMAGCVIEGETVLIAAGLAAQGGYLSLPLVVLSAWIGATSGDHFFFILGRCKGSSIIAFRPSWRGPIERALGLVQRYGNLLILGSRFACGFRAVGPFAIGTAGIGVVRFVSLNLTSSLTWALFFGLTSYLSGAAVRPFFAGARLPLIGLLIALCCAALLVLRRPSLTKTVFRIARMFLSRLGPANRLLRNLRLSHGHQA